MKNTRRIIAYIIYLFLGIGLLSLGYLQIADSFWIGMGTALIVVGALRLIQMYRLQNNETYRENTEIAAKDERNCFIRNKAWAVAGYCFVIIAAVATIALKVMDQELLSIAASGAVCLVALLYWGAYMILRKKY